MIVNKNNLCFESHYLRNYSPNNILKRVFSYKFFPMLPSYFKMEILVLREYFVPLGGERLTHYASPNKLQ